MATLTYVYAEQTAVLGPLATYAEPHTYDLCRDHAQRLTAPVGWDVVRLVRDDQMLAAEDRDPDDLFAVARAVRAGPPPGALLPELPSDVVPVQSPGSASEFDPRPPGRRTTSEAAAVGDRPPGPVEPEPPTSRGTRRRTVKSDRGRAAHLRVLNGEAGGADTLPS